MQAVFPEKEQYIQEKSKFEVEKRYEEKAAVFHEKKASYEIQMSNKNDSTNFNRIHTFEINMAQYLNQVSDNIDLEALQQIHVLKPNVLFEYTDPKSKLKCKVWVDIELGDVRYQGSMAMRMSAKQSFTSVTGDSRMNELMNNLNESVVSSGSNLNSSVIIERAQSDSKQIKDLEAENYTMK